MNGYLMRAISIKHLKIARFQKYEDSRDILKYMEEKYIDL